MIRFYRWLLPVAVGAAAVLGGRPAAGMQVKLDDSYILASLDHTYTDEIEHATLAINRASLPEAKALAQHIREACSTAQTQGRELAERLRISLVIKEPSAVADSHKAMISDMNAMKGPDFDRAYVEHEISDHQALLDFVNKTLLPSASNPEVKALLQRMAPVIKSNIDEAKAAKQRMNKP